jgi:hypothetical protein
MMDRKSWAWAIHAGGNPRDDYMHRAMREVAEAMAQRQRQRTERIEEESAAPDPQDTGEKRF